MVYSFNPSTWEAEAGGSLNSRPFWSTYWVPEHPELYNRLSQNKTKSKNKQSDGDRTC